MVIYNFNLTTSHAVVWIMMKWLLKWQQLQNLALMNITIKQHISKISKKRKEKENMNVLV